MYPNLEAERAKTKTTLATIANDERVKCTISTLSLKLSGKAPLLFKEAIAIKDILNSDLTLEELFEEKEENENN